MQALASAPSSSRRCRAVPAGQGGGGGAVSAGGGGSGQVSAVSALRRAVPWGGAGSARGGQPAALSPSHPLAPIAWADGAWLSHVAVAGSAGGTASG